jgi:hypothetical protein
MPGCTRRLACTAAGFCLCCFWLLSVTACAAASFCLCCCWASGCTICCSYRLSPVFADLLSAAVHLHCVMYTMCIMCIMYTTHTQAPANATTVSFYSRLQGPNITATWSIADVTIVQLDNTLRNVIRTNTTGKLTAPRAATVQCSAVDSVGQ